MIAHRPGNVGELRDLIVDAVLRKAQLELRGGGSCVEIGAPRDAEFVDMRGFVGAIDYDPAELILTAGAGTPLTEIQHLLAASGQHLAFDPWSAGPLFGRLSGASTIGGIVAAGQAGSGRLSGGGARDHLLGFTAVSGRGEMFVAGGKVVKNVTGYDLPKLMAGSWGRLGAMTTLTLKTLPKPRETFTRTCQGFSIDQAVRLFNVALGSRAGISAAAYSPDPWGSGGSLTALRIDGVGPSVRSRLAVLDSLLGDAGLRGDRLGQDGAIWEEMRTLSSLAGRGALWRVSLPPSFCPTFVGELRASGAGYLVDWAGARVWLTFDGPAAQVRDAAARGGGHAMLVRADPEQRATMPTFHPQQGPLVALEARVRRAFDPSGVFETRRF